MTSISPMNNKLAPGWRMADGSHTNVMLEIVGPHALVKEKVRANRPLSSPQTRGRVLQQFPKDIGVNHTVCHRNLSPGIGRNPSGPLKNEVKNEANFGFSRHFQYP